LQKSPFFSQVGKDELAEVAARVHERAFRRGEVILLEGETPFVQTPTPAYLKKKLISSRMRLQSFLTLACF